MIKMKVIVYKENSEIMTKISIDDAKEKDFDYIELINAIYDGKEVTLDIRGLEKQDEEKIKELFNEIRKKSEKENVNDKKPVGV